MRADTNYKKAVRIDKVVSMILYKLALGSSIRTIRQKFAQGRSIIQRYNLIICRVFANKNLLFFRNVSTPIGQRLHNVISWFHDLSGFPNKRGAIDGTHIKLYQKPPQWYILANYWSHYGFYSILLQGICDGDKIIWNVHIIVPCGTH